MRCEGDFTTIDHLALADQPLEDGARPVRDTTARVLTRDRGTAVVAVCFGLAIALAAVLLFTGTGESASVEWTRGAAVPRALPPGLTVVDDAIPVDVVPEVQAWTGSQLLTFGARGGAIVGAVYEPSTGRWHAMSAAPFGTVLEGPAAVWTGRIWVVVGVLCREGSSSCDGALAAAAYDPATDAWTSVDANPQPAAGTGRGHDPIVGRGVGMLGSNAVFVLDGQYYAFRPDSWDWDWLPAPPPSDGVACSVDGEIVLPDVKTSTFSVLAPGASAWSTVRPTTAAIKGPALGTVCTDASVLVFAPDLSSVAAFDVAARQWSRIAPPPLPVTGPLVAGFTGKSVVFWRPEEVVDYDLAISVWRSAPPGLSATPDKVSWTQLGIGLSISDDGRTLTAYNA